MKWFLISLAIGLAASDKLDRTYLPPPGAHLAGGILGSHDAPLEPPHHPHSEPGPVFGGQGAQPNFGINGEPLNFGDKIPKVPVTTTSYAFSQTTTYPPGEGFETTALPINPVTGLPIQLEQGLQNFPYGFSQGQQNVQNLPGYTQTQGPPFGTSIQPSFTTTQAPTYGSNIQPGFGPQGPTSAPVNIGSPGFDQFANQPLNQYQGQNLVTPGGAPQIPGSVYPGQNQGQLQYPGGQSNTQGFLPTGAPDNQRLDKYPGQSVVNPGGVVQIPGGNQGLVQYPGGPPVTGQQGFVPTTGSPINLQPGGNQSGVNYDGSRGPISQGTYTGQPINEQNLGGTQPTQTIYQNQEPINIGGIPSQYPTGNQNYGTTVSTGSENVYQPGSTPSTLPLTYINGVSSTTPYLGATSSTSSYSSVQPVYRPERPQAAADRNAVILNYENVRTPNGYSYSFDTSNGIHADESGIVDNGTKAQGSYSYIGDDGKVYSVIYTADENGFQPHGDHLPTPPPIPEAIQRVIEQAARDKAAGIVHDGSYDEARYGDHNYRGTANRPRPQNQGTNQLIDNDQFNRAKDDLRKPIAGIKDEKYNDGVTKDQFNNNLPIADTQKGLNGKLAATRPSNQRNGENNVQDVSVGNGRVPDDFHSPRGDFDGNRMPIVEDKINQLNNYGAKKQEPAGRQPGLRGNNFPTHAIDSDENNISVSKNRRPSERRPISGGVKDVTEKYPGSNVVVGTTDKSETAENGFSNGEDREIDSGSPNVVDGSGENTNSNYNSVTGAPIIRSKIQTLRQRIKGNRGPDSTGNRNTQNNNGRLQGETFTQETTEMPSFSDYFKKSIANQQATQQGDNGYHYQQPNTKFEQNTFPTRFGPQEVPTTQPDQRRTEYVEGTTRKPFMTPNVYYQSNRNNQSTPNVNNQNYKNRHSTPNNENKSTTRRPYTTPFNTDNSYTDYDDGDYATDQDIGNDRIQSTRKPADIRVTSRPYQSTQTTSTPQNAPSGQRTRVDAQKSTVSPGRRTENPGTESSGYTYGPTTQMPSHNSRFGNTEIPRKMKPQELRPTKTVPDSTTTVGTPVTTQSLSVIGQPDYKYQTTGPNFKYPGANVGSGYPTTSTFPGTGSIPPGESTPRDYYTSTYGPIQDYFSTTTVPPTSGYTQGSGSQFPSGTSGSYQPPQDETFQTGYHYGPPKTGSVNLDGPGFFKPTGTSGVFPTSTGTYQQGPDGFPSTTFVPITPGNQNTFIPSQPGTFSPETSPTRTYPGNYQNGPSTPGYDTTIVSSTPGGKPVFVYPESTGAQETTGYEYGTTRPTYSTTESPSTPGSFIPTGSAGLTQDYSTTYRPSFQPAPDTFVGGPVDGFGRPIVTDQVGSHPGFVNPTQGPSGPVNNVGPNFDGTDKPVTYPGGYDQTRVIGEDFSGPKQPQRFDPKTGYHYK